MRKISAEILCVGTELLIGDIINTNASYISKKLCEIGISVYRQSVVGDNPERLKGAISDALLRSDVLITSGGLGPTYDDITKETVAELLGLGMYYDDAVADRIHKYFERIGREMPPSNEKQAMTPIGAHIIANPRGTAPGLMIDGEYGGKNITVIMLPGPPCELEPMTDESVLPLLAEKFDAEKGIFYSRNLHFTGIGESSLEEIILPVMSSINPTVAPYAGEGEVRLRVTASAKTEEECKSLCDRKTKEILSYGVGKYMYSSDCGSIEETLVKALKEKKLTISVAESCTGGLISKRITDIPGASEVFPGGVCSYAERIKELVVGVSHETIEKYGVVSEECAREMAEGICWLMGTDIALSVTGYAGPGGGDEKNPVGTVYIGVATKERSFVKRYCFSSLRDRVFIRRAASNYALGLALSEINDGEFDIR